MYDAINSRYTYKGTNVVKNKLSITDEKKLENEERMLVNKKIENIDKNFSFVRFNEVEFKLLHKYLFGDIYEFAGEYRLENITKGNFKFSLFEYIEDNMQDIFKKIDIDTLASLDFNNLVINISSIMTELNVLHPFREGNGRTIRLFISKLLEQLGYKINFQYIDYDEIMRASKLAVIDETEQIKLLKRYIKNNI